MKLFPFVLNNSYSYTDSADDCQCMPNLKVIQDVAYHLWNLLGPLWLVLLLRDIL